jgi:hypothetical protein
LIELKKSQLLPIALAINSESRQEALRFYLIIHRPRYIGPTPIFKPKPLCFRIDVVGEAWITTDILWESPLGQGRWFDRISRAHPQLITSIQTLEIRNIYKAYKSGIDLLDACKLKELRRFENVFY